MQTFEIILLASLIIIFLGLNIYKRKLDKKIETLKKEKTIEENKYKLVFIPITEIDKQYQNIIKPEFLRNHLLKDDAKFIEFIKSGNTEEQISMLEEFEKSEMYNECSIIRDVINGKL